MYIAVLIAKPGGLAASDVEALAQEWGGGPLRWLSEGEAAEFDLLGPLPMDAPAKWERLNAQGIDLAILSGEGRRKAILIADMDSTMIEQECIDEMAAAAGIGEDVASITRRAMNGELDFEGALKARVRLLEGQPEALIPDVIRDRITFRAGGKTLLATMKANGCYTALVSGGFTAFTAHVAEALGFDEHRANTLLAEDGILTGEVGLPILGRDAKVDALLQIATAKDLTNLDALAVGDGANDLGMLTLAGMGVALHAKPAVQAEVDVRVNHGDLTALLFLQGYRRDEFVTP